MSQMEANCTNAHPAAGGKDLKQPLAGEAAGTSASALTVT